MTNSTSTPSAATKSPHRHQTPYHRTRHPPLPNRRNAAQRQHRPHSRRQKPNPPSRHPHDPHMHHHYPWYRRHDPHRPSPRRHPQQTIVLTGALTPARFSESKCRIQPRHGLRHRTNRTIGRLHHHQRHRLSRRPGRQGPRTRLLCFQLGHNWCLMKII